MDMAIGFSPQRNSDMTTVFQVGGYRHISVSGRKNKLSFYVVAPLNSGPSKMWKNAEITCLAFI